jgi:hypothetical protein
MSTDLGINFIEISVYFSNLVDDPTVIVVSDWWRCMDVVQHHTLLQLVCAPTHALIDTVYDDAISHLTLYHTFIFM